MSLTEQFRVSNVANNPSNSLWIPYGYTFVRTIEFSLTVKCVIIRRKTVMRISFSSFTFQNIFNFLNIGYQLVKNQHIKIVDQEAGIGMNAFFQYWSKMFFDQAKGTILSFLNESQTRRLVLQGMSMGGAMAQCFYYYLKTSGIIKKCLELNVMAFGSPRIGNVQLGKWISGQNQVHNYSICIDLDGVMTGDPVCYFPSKKYGYTNNHNLIPRHKNKLYGGDISNRNSDTDVSFRNFWNEWTFIKKTDLRVWDAVHSYDEYIENI